MIKKIKEKKKKQKTDKKKNNKKLPIKIDKDVKKEPIYNPNPIAGVIGFPTRGMVSTYFMMARAHLSGTLGISWSDFIVTDEVARQAGIDSTSVAAKKQLIAEHAISQGAEWILFLDDDVLFPPDTLLKLLQSGKDIIGGVYWSKSDPCVPLMFRDHMKGPYLDWHAGDLIRVDAMGMGLTFIKTKVFKALPKPWFSENYVYHNLDITDKRNIGTTEDLYFYKKARDFGFEVWCDTSIQAQHYEARSGRMFGLTAEMPQAIPASDTKKRGKKLIADIGCGTHTPFFKEGIPVRMDIREDVNPDIICDIRKIPEPDMKYDIVYSSHVLEHFSHRITMSVLVEWLRILKKGGELRLELPNIEPAAKAILDKKITNYDMWTFWGEQAYAKDYHGTGFTIDSLRNLLEVVGGLKDIKIIKRGGERHLYATAKKWKHISFESISPEYSFKKGNTMKGYSKKDRLAKKS